MFENQQYLNTKALNGKGESFESAALRSSFYAPGFTDNVFEGKQEQMFAVQCAIKEKGLLPVAVIEHEVAWFYDNLGIDDLYFRQESVQTIANHITALYGAKVLASVKKDEDFDLNLEHETENGAVFIHNSKPGVSRLNGPQFEYRIDSKYLDRQDDQLYRLETYRSKGTVSESVSSQLRCYFLTKCSFEQTIDRLETSLSKVSDSTFLQRATQDTLELYQEMMREIVHHTGPVIRVVNYENAVEKRLVIGFRRGSVVGFFSALSDLYHYYSMFSTRKYVEQFANGVTIISLSLEPTPRSKFHVDHVIHQIVKEASLLYCLPLTPFQHQFKSGILSVQEMDYAFVNWIFAQHFLNRLGNDYATLTNILNHQDSVHMNVLNNIKKRLRQETFTREYILDIVKQYPTLVKMCYVHFARIHHVANSPVLTRSRLSGTSSELTTSLSEMRLHEENAPMTTQDILDHIRHTVSNAHEMRVFEMFLTFNLHVQKTNFYQANKVALSFRLDASFLLPLEYPDPVFGLFLVVGSEFRGFHLRFRDIARGGLRMIRSVNKEVYGMNLRNLFDENYNLAWTQQRKNKDIPEGGAKGTILLNVDAQDRAEVAFQKYVDAMLDLLLAPSKIIDLYGQPEILFFGPDEGTADYMNWASQRAKQRGASFWKAFTTGKSQSMGGIPHDVFGMTTRSIHQYVLGALDILKLDEQQCTKFQTGGPDGDLGSNEIKISKDRTIGIVDGSGVIYDPNGLDRAELLHLASQRLTISHFNVSKLSSNGCRVLVTDKDVVLPDGTVVESGLKFRNTFHLNKLSSATYFVPCGGRPEAVDLSNVKDLYDSQGRPRFKFIVEGANLFFTQEARLELEKDGVIIFKDASANKGGVTSSSLEVLAALAFDDEEFDSCMTIKDDRVPEFYQAYVANVHEIIENNARLEFQCIWKEHEKNLESCTVLSDKLSKSINKLNDDLQGASILWQNEPLRRAVLAEAFPKTLLSKLGLQKIMHRVPENYQRAIFGAHLASRFVYQYGVEPAQFSFFEFINSYEKRVVK